MAEQRALIRDLQSQVDTVVGRALVQREAEAIVAAEDARRPTGTPRRGPRAAAGAVVAGLIGVLAFGTGTTLPTPAVAPLAGEPGTDLVVVASERVQPIEVAFDRVADVLAELRSALAGRARGGTSRHVGPTGTSSGAGSGDAPSDRAVVDRDAARREVAGSGADRRDDRRARWDAPAAPDVRDAPADLGVDLPSRHDEVEPPSAPGGQDDLLELQATLEVDPDPLGWLGPPLDGSLADLDGG
jgi:hypothetical protein